MTGQVVFHLLAAAHAHRALWPVTMLVACMPVGTVGFGVALAHLLRPEPSPRAPHLRPPPSRMGPVPEPPAELNGHGHAALELFGDDLTRGDIPGVRRIRREMHLGQPRAQAIRDYLTEVAAHP